jgi:hypothetical protein
MHLAKGCVGGITATIAQAIERYIVMAYRKQYPGIGGVGALRRDRRCFSFTKTVR